MAANDTNNAAGGTPAPKKPPVKVSVAAKGSGRGAKNAAPAPEGVEDDSKRMGSARRGILFILVVCVIYALYLVFSGQLGTFLSAMRGVDYLWVIAACFVYVIYYFLGVFAYVLAVAKDPKTPLGLRDLMSVEASGIFFSNLTPNGAGGAPAQIYRLARAGLSVGGAGAVQYTRFLIYEFAEALFAAIMLIFRLHYFVDLYGNLMFIGVVLFGYKVVELTAILLVCLAPGIVTRLGEWVINLFVRHGWLREERRGRWDELAINQVQQFSIGFKGAAKNVRGMVETLGVTMVQLACLYSLSWFVLNAFHIESDIVTCLAAGSMLELLTSAIPLPGGTGGAEGGFAFLYRPLFGDAVAAGYVVWRAVEYFIPVAAAAPLTTLQSRDGRDNVHKLYLGVHNWVEGGSKRKRRHKSHGAKINPRKFR